MSVKWHVKYAMERSVRNLIFQNSNETATGKSTQSNVRVNNHDAYQRWNKDGVLYSVIGVRCKTLVIILLNLYQPWVAQRKLGTLFIIY